VTVSFHRVNSEDSVLVEWVYRVRYEVYCLECGFENPENYLSGMEWDQYDPYSIHFIALDDSCGAVGTVRLILDSQLGFPIEKHCQISIRGDQLPRHRGAEISRLAVTRQCRCPEITLGLWKSVYLESKRLGILYWYAAMERKLERLLRKSRLVFEQIGVVVDYNGLRAPFIGRIASLGEGLATESPGMYGYFREGWEQEYRLEKCSQSWT